eukprot:13262856-Alexandrium_andersonii.AAC.1
MCIRDRLCLQETHVSESGTPSMALFARRHGWNLVASAAASADGPGRGRGGLAILTKCLLPAPTSA